MTTTGYYYYLIQNPNAPHKRPLGVADVRSVKTVMKGEEIVSLRDLRLKENGNFEEEEKGKNGIDAADNEVQKISDDNKANDDDKVNDDMDGPNKQFHDFLRDNRLDKYYDKFKENDCSDIRDIGYLLEDEGFLKNEIGMKNPIERKRFLGEGQELKGRMDHFKSQYQIPIILHKNLAKKGIVTIDILCQEIQNKSDLKDKLDINNDNQQEFLWEIINNQINPKMNNENNDESEEYQEEGADDLNLDEEVTPYI